MPTKGRPLAMHTIIIRLRGLADNAEVEADRTRQLANMADTLDSTWPNITAAKLGQFVKALDIIATEHADVDDGKWAQMLVAVIDSLARYQSSTLLDKPRKVAPVSKKPQWMRDNEASDATATNGKPAWMTVEAEPVAATNTPVLDFIDDGSDNDEVWEELLVILRALRRVG